jgi:hypothetical protein
LLDPAPFAMAIQECATDVRLLSERPPYQLAPHDIDVRLEYRPLSLEHCRKQQAGLWVAPALNFLDASPYIGPPPLQNSVAFPKLFCGIVRLGPTHDGIFHGPDNPLH